MMVTKIFTWWYSTGWLLMFKKSLSRFDGVINFFSMNSLLRTLFKPYRQISAESANTSASLDLKFHMFIDRLVSRIVGFFLRLVLLIVGIIFIIFNFVFSLLFMILWPLVPVAPIFGVILCVAGVIV